MLKNVTDKWSMIFQSFEENSVDSKINMNFFKDNIKEQIKDY